MRDEDSLSIQCLDLLMRFYVEKNITLAIEQPKAAMEKLMSKLDEKRGIESFNYISQSVLPLIGRLLALVCILGVQEVIVPYIKQSTFSRFGNRENRQM